MTFFSVVILTCINHENHVFSFCSSKHLPKHFQGSFKISCFDSLYCVVQKLSVVFIYFSLLQHTHGSRAKILLWFLRWNLKLKTFHKCPLYLDLWKAYLTATFHCVAMSMSTLKNVEHLHHNENVLYLSEHWKTFTK